jgi:hypothetical protein
LKCTDAPKSYRRYGDRVAQEIQIVGFEMLVEKNRPDRRPSVKIPEYDALDSKSAQATQGSCLGSNALGASEFRVTRCYGGTCPQISACR